MKTTAEVGKILGVTRDTALKLGDRLDVGLMKAGMWWYTDEEIEILKQNCQKYLKANRGEV
jgi:hypothetical protein